MAVVDHFSDQITLIDGESGGVLAIRRNTISGITDMTHDIFDNVYVYYANSKVVSVISRDLLQEIVDQARSLCILCV